MESGASVQQETLKTKWWEAVDQESTPYCQRLIDQKADVNWQDADGKTALHRVASKSPVKKEMVEYLIVQRADISLRDNEGTSPLWWTWNQGFATRIQYFLLSILSKLEKDFSSKSGRSLIAKPHTVNRRDFVVGDLNENDRDIWNRLKQYVSKRQVSALNQELRDYRGDHPRILNAKEKGKTLLHLAIESMWHSEADSVRGICEILLRQGASINAKTDMGENALHLIPCREGNLAYCGHGRIMEFLVERGIDITHWGGENKDLSTLYDFTNKVFAKRTDYLLLAGIRRLEKELGEIGHPVIRSVVMPPRYSDLHVAAEEGNKRECEHLLVLGVNINLCDPNGKTPLHLVPNDRRDLFELLVERGADVTLRDQTGASCLYAFTNAGWAKRADAILIAALSRLRKAIDQLPIQENAWRNGPLLFKAVCALTRQRLLPQLPEGMGVQALQERIDHGESLSVGEQVKFFMSQFVDQMEEQESRYDEDAESIVSDRMNVQALLRMYSLFLSNIDTSNVTENEKLREIAKDHEKRLARLSILLEGEDEEKREAVSALAASIGHTLHGASFKGKRKKQKYTSVNQREKHPDNDKGNSSCCGC